MVNPDYAVGFVDGEGCFCVPISVHKTLVRRREVRPTFEIEVREDDLPILRKIQRVLGCGKIYRLEFKRYEKWKPHVTPRQARGDPERSAKGRTVERVKLKVSKLSDLQNILIPFFERHPLQAKKRKSFRIFKRIVRMVARKKHLTPEGIAIIEQLRDQMNT